MMKIRVKSRLFGSFSQQRMKIVLASGQRAVMKLSFVDKNGPVSSIRQKIDREKTALRLLQGLAVPELIDVDKHELVESKDKFECVVTGWIPWKDVRKREFSVHQAAGVWLFVLEQLCAFRRRGILYTDLKPEHILVNRNLSSGVIIDFDWATAADRQAIYPYHLIGSTLPFMAPEVSFTKRLTESALVYASVILFASFLKKGMNNFEFQGLSGRVLKRQLCTGGFSSIWKLLEAGLSKDPEKRPSTYEDLFEKAKECIDSKAALRIWKKLRAPYQESLQELGLEFVENETSKNKRAA